MKESDWTTLVDSASEMANFYTRPPSLSECKLNYAQIDERGTSVTLIFETRTLPDDPPPVWADREYNAVEFYLKFTGVKDLRVVGWDFSISNARVTLRPQEGDRIQVSVEAASSRIHFNASGSALTRTRTYLAGAE